MKVDLGEQLPWVEVVITNILGQEITRKRFTEVSELELDISGSAGVYFLMLRSGNSRSVIRILKQ